MHDTIPHSFNELTMTLVISMLKVQMKLTAFMLILCLHLSATMENHQIKYKSELLITSKKEILKIRYVKNVNYNCILTSLSNKFDQNIDTSNNLSCLKKSKRPN